ncbi:MAG: prolyl oligopeptidase family serine peptidase [Nocardioides sp.]|nr:prolyl oligopeptidase family serine peptidase [Nocardioides sp.]
MPSPSTEHPSETDPHLWLEEVTGEAALAWVGERNAHAEATLAGPVLERTEAAILQVLDSEDRIPLLGLAGDWYYNVWRDADHERGVWRRTTLESYRSDDPQWDDLIDLDALSVEEGEQWVWHGAAILRTGPLAFTRALVTLSRSGSDADTTREWDLLTRDWVDPLDPVSPAFVRPEGKGHLRWVDEDTVLVATDTGPESLTRSGYPRVARRWRRGQPLGQAQVLLEVDVADLGVGVRHDRTPGHEQTWVTRSTGFYSGLTYLVREDDSLELVEVPESAQTSLWRGRLLVDLREDWAVGGTTYAAGSLLATGLDDFRAGGRDLAVLFEPTPTTAILGWNVTRHRLVLTCLEDVQHRVQVLTPPAEGGTGWDRHPMTGLTELASVLVWPVDAVDSDRVWVQSSGYLSPPELAVCDLGAHGPPTEQDVLRRSPAYFDTDASVVEQRFATSLDGTRVPYFLVRPRDLAAGGTTPTVLYGYGGFEVSLTPSYSGATGRAWLARGGAYAVANIRGGGEYGPGWHQAALREHRHRAYEDFAAVAADLVATGVTSREHLGVMGGSNGGLLTGNMLVRYPELVGAVVSAVPLLDMLRYTRLLAGASWIAEYGDPDDPADREFVREISAYHRLDPATTYPPVLLTTSTRDDRVHPGHARKMAARLMELGQDVTSWENVEGGHGGSSTNAQAAHRTALEWEFLATRLGLGSAG